MFLFLFLVLIILTSRRYLLNFNYNLIYNSNQTLKWMIQNRNQIAV
jgi:hypothetical protein